MAALKFYGQAKQTCPYSTGLLNLISLLKLKKHILFVKANSSRAISSMFPRTWTLKWILLFIAFNSLLIVSGGKKSKTDEKPAWAKKDIRDYSEADLERLLDQWDVCSMNLMDIQNLNALQSQNFFFLGR